MNPVVRFAVHFLLIPAVGVTIAALGLAIIARDLWRHRRA